MPLPITLLNSLEQSTAFRTLWSEFSRALGRLEEQIGVANSATRRLLRPNSSNSPDYIADAIARNEAAQIANQSIRQAYAGVEQVYSSFHRDSDGNYYHLLSPESGETLQSTSIHNRIHAFMELVRELSTEDVEWILTGQVTSPPTPSTILPNTGIRIDRVYEDVEDDEDDEDDEDAVHFPPAPVEDDEPSRPPSTRARGPAPTTTVAELANALSAETTPSTPAAVPYTPSPIVRGIADRFRQLLQSLGDH